MWNWVSQLEKYRKEGQPLALVTVTACTGSTPREVGAKMIVLPDGRFHGTIGGGHLEELAINDARACLVAGESKTVRYPLGAKTGQCCGGIVDVLIETLNNGPRLYLFGAGHVAQAICRTLVGTPFTVHLVDERAEWVLSDQVPAETLRFHGDWDDFAKTAVWDAKKTYVAILTHRHDLDQEILEHVAKLPTRYLGLIGSRSKWERFKQRIGHKGLALAAFERVRCPMGIPIGGKAPQEIAISVAAELLRIHHEDQRAVPRATAETEDAVLE